MLPRVTILPHLRAFSWHDGPPHEPLTRYGHPAPTLSRVPLDEALRARYPTDALAQDVGSAADTAPEIPRISTPVAAVWGDRLYRRLAFADFDTEGHERWPEGHDLETVQATALGLLTTHVAMPLAVYTTRAGLRAIWALDRPVPVVHWGWFTRWVESSGLKSLTKRAEWGALGLKKGAVDVEECKSPVALFRLPYVHRDGVDLDPPAPIVLPAAPPIVTDVDPTIDTYRLTPHGGLGDAPDVPARLSPTDPGWSACGLLAWREAPALPTSKVWEWARRRKVEDGGWPQGGPPEDLQSASGVRSTIASLAGRAVKALSQTDLSPDAIAETVYGVLAPLVVVGGREASRTEYPESAEYLWACLGYFVETLAERDATDPERPLVIACAGESGFRWRTPAGDYKIVRESLLIPTLTKHHRALEIPGKVDQVYLQWGAGADKVVYSFIRPTVYEADGDGGGTLVVNRAPLIEVEPRFDPLCDEWLRALVTDGHYEAVCEVIGGLRHLHVPCAALFLCGEGGTGKEMFVRALSAQFGAHPVMLDKAAQKHNTSMLECPIVWADEKSRAPHSPSVFKELTGQKTHAVEPKGQAVATLEGYLRIVVTSNVSDPIGFAKALRGEAETGVSHRATAQRIRYIDVPDTARLFLEKRGNFSLTEDWVHTRDGLPGRLTRHFRHLMVTASPAIGSSRFIATPTDRTWLDRLTMSGGVETDLTAALFETLQTWQGSKKVTLGPAICWTSRGCWINAAKLREKWSEFMGPGSRAWRRDTLYAALRNLDSRDAAGEERVSVPGWGRVRAYYVPASRLEQVAEMTGLDQDVAGLLADAGQATAPQGPQ